MSRDRRAQLAYSDLMPKMLDEQARRQKAEKILAVIRHFLGRDDLSGLRALDVGCSGGFISDSLAAAGLVTHGVDIDVPGLTKAQERFGDRVRFVCGDGKRMPFADDAFDVIVFNHIYEHVVDPEAVLAELRRVLSPTGVLYLGLMNRLGPIEPHYRLPFLSYLPPKLADSYVRTTGRAEHYHERSRTRPGLRRMLRDFRVWDYTLPVLAEPERFASTDVVSPKVTKIPPGVLRALLPIIPTYVWAAAKTDLSPAGPEVRRSPRLL